MAVLVGRAHEPRRARAVKLHARKLRQPPCYAGYAKIERTCRIAKRIVSQVTGRACKLHCKIRLVKMTILNGCN